MDVIVDVAGYTERLCTSLSGTLLGDFRFRWESLIFTVAPYGPADSGALHIQASSSSGDLDAPLMPGILVRRGRPIERVADELRLLLRPPSLVEKILHREIPPEQADLLEAARALKSASHVPNYDPIIECYSACREAAYVAALTEVGALDRVDAMMAQLKVFGVDMTKMSISGDPQNMAHSWQHTVDASRLVGAWPPRGRARENRRWRRYIEDAIHAIRRGDEAARRRAVAAANRVRGLG